MAEGAPMRIRGAATLSLLLIVIQTAACTSGGTGAIPTATATSVATMTATPTPAAPTTPAGPVALRTREFDVPSGAHPHDVAPATDGGVWYTAQFRGALGYLDPKTGATRHIALGTGSSPHGVILGPDGAPWVTDSGLNAIVRVDPRTDAVTVFRLPISANANLNTAVFAPTGRLWFTGQNGYYGHLDPASGAMRVLEAPRGRGPYGITATPSGEIYYASLAGNHIARVDPQSAEATVIDPPTRNQGARRVWSDSKGKIWVSEYSAGQVARYDPADRTWREWKLPGQAPLTYSVYVDGDDNVWLTDFGANAVVRFEPASERFTAIPHPRPNAAVRQMLGRPGEVWGAMSGHDRLIVIYTS
jgi:virginiamycin B lyase